MAAKIDKEKCDGCGDCVESCPMDSISIQEGKAAVDADTCADCGACVDVCPNQAISMD